MAKANNDCELSTDLFLIHFFTLALCVSGAKVIIVIIDNSGVILFKQLTRWRSCRQRCETHFLVGRKRRVNVSGKRWQLLLQAQAVVLPEALPVGHLYINPFEGSYSILEY